MQVITIEENAYKNLLRWVEELIQTSKKMSDELFLQNHKYLTVADVGAIKGNTAKSIKSRKNEIGFN